MGVEQMVEPVQPRQPLLLTEDVFGQEEDDPKGAARAVKKGRAHAGEVPKKHAGKHPKNTLNELSGDEWIFFTKSVITTAYASEYGHGLRKQHGANKPPQLMKSLIEFFTPAGGRVLDPFAGVGGTLIGAAISDPPRECAGIEINPHWVDVYRRVVRESQGLPEFPVHVGDSRALLADAALFPDESFDFVCTDPPYNVHLEQTMSNDERYAHANRRSDYNMRSDAPEDLANLESYERFLDGIQEVLRGCFRVLRPGRYLAVILRNAYQGGRYVFTHVDVARRAEAEGFVPKGEKIWYQAGTRLRPYGYPFAYIPNIAHQYIVIFQKPRVEGRGTRAGGAARETPSTRSKRPPAHAKR
jgi:DNA modification methylase